MPGPQLTREQRQLRDTIESRVRDMTIGAGVCESPHPTDAQLEKLWKGLSITDPGALEIKWAHAAFREAFQCFHQP